jgi:hypothetical protein
MSSMLVIACFVFGVVFGGACSSAWEMGFKTQMANGPTLATVLLPHH